MVQLYDILSTFLKCCAIQFLLDQIFQNFYRVLRGPSGSNPDKFKTINLWDFEYAYLTEHCNFLFYFYNFPCVILRMQSVYLFSFGLLHLGLLDICL